MMKDDVYRWIAARVPKKLRYFIFVDGFAKATCGKYSNTEVGKITAMEVLKRLENEDLV